MPYAAARAIDAPSSYALSATIAVTFPPRAMSSASGSSRSRLTSFAFDPLLFSAASTPSAGGCENVT